MAAADGPQQTFLASHRVPTPKLRDRAAVLSLVAADGYDLKHASPELRDDVDVVRAALTHDARAIVYASHECQVCP
jgi:hypothetical protein